MAPGPEPRRDEPAERRRWFRRRRTAPEGPAADRAIGEFGSEDQADEGGDSDTS
jgi:hypothetical protein